MIRKLIIEYTEKVYIPKNNLGFLRHELPQIEDDMQDKFFDYLKKQGISLKNGRTKPSKLKPTQKEINREAAQELVDTNSPKLKKPLIVSSDGYIMDGHHRWLGLVIKGSSSADVINVGADIKKLIGLANAFPHVMKKNMSNKTI